MKYFLIGTLGLGLLSFDAPAQSSDRAPGATFEACVAARVAANPGRFAAEAAAYKACREQFPASSEETDAVRRRALVTGTTATATTTAVPTVASTGSSASPTTAPAAAPIPSSAPPAPVTAPAPAPAPFIPPLPGGPSGSPGASGSAPGAGKH